MHNLLIIIQLFSKAFFSWFAAKFWSLPIKSCTNCFICFSTYKWWWTLLQLANCAIMELPLKSVVLFIAFGTMVWIKYVEATDNMVALCDTCIDTSVKFVCVTVTLDGFHFYFTASLPPSHDPIFGFGAPYCTHDTCWCSRCSSSCSCLQKGKSYDSPWNPLVVPMLL